VPATHRGTYDRQRRASRTIRGTESAVRRSVPATARAAQLATSDASSSDHAAARSPVLAAPTAQARAALQAIEQEQSPYTALRARDAAELARLEASLRATELIENTLTRDLQYLTFWQEGFGNSGVKSLLLDTVTPYLSYRASEYLEALTGGTARVEFATQKTLASGDKRDRFEVRVSYDFGGDTYRAISGGERRRIDLACLFAVGDLAASRSVAPVRLRLLDEPFDNLDGVGAEQIVREELQLLGRPSATRGLQTEYLHSVVELPPRISREVGEFPGQIRTTTGS
jgi:DNA repair exonuclease SbcCD ATPase subunit